MMTTLLIGLGDIKEFKSISANIDTSKNLDMYIQQAQDIDLKLFLGEQFYIDLLDDFEASPSLTKYALLFNGGTYTVANRSFRHSGLRAVIAYFAYERYILNSGIQSTRFGMVQKKNDWSDAVPESTIRRLAANARSQAVFFQGEVKKYLDLNWQEFEFWYGGRSRRKGSMRVSASGGSHTQKGRRDVGHGRYCRRCGEVSCICYSH